MKSLERRFKNIRSKNPLWGDYIVFAKAVDKQGFSNQIVTRWFNKLVNKNEYEKSEKKQLIKHLLVLTKRPRRTKNKPKKAF